MDSEHFFQARFESRAFHFAVSAEHGREMSNMELMSVKQVASYIGCSEEAVRLWKAQGRLRFLKAGPRLLRFRKEDVDRFLTRNGGIDREEVEVAS